MKTKRKIISLLSKNYVRKETLNDFQKIVERGKATMLEASGYFLKLNPEERVEFYKKNRKYLFPECLGVIKTQLIQSGGQELLSGELFSEAEVANLFLNEEFSRPVGAKLIASLREKMREVKFIGGGDMLYCDSCGSQYCYCSGGGDYYVPNYRAALQAALLVNDKVELEEGFWNSLTGLEARNLIDIFAIYEGKGSGRTSEKSVQG
jgi:hypothetical protein